VYYELTTEKKRQSLEKMAKLLFMRCPYVVISSRQVSGGFDPSTKRLKDVKYITTVRLDRYVPAPLQLVVESAKDRFLEMLKQWERFDWTLQEPTVFLIEGERVNGYLVTEFSGRTLVDFWFNGGQIYAKVVCYGYVQ